MTLNDYYKEQDRWICQFCDFEVDDVNKLETWKDDDRVICPECDEVEPAWNVFRK